ncbi:MAG: hypothetical protein JO240_02545, partial [Solirubrobacterales bacterium]|nr:hypothetical protein [Solirubrobacterales bacterium]
PGGTPANRKLAMNLPAFPANLRKQLKGANYPAPHHIMAAAVEGAQVDFDNAIEIEGRYFVDLVTGQVSKNMIQAFFFDMQRVSGSRGRPEGLETFKPRKMVVLGAGMMGAAIAYVSAKAGIEVVLKDVDLAAAERGKGYSEKLVAKAIERGRSTQEQGDALLARITPTDDPAKAQGAELVIEAVFEDPGVKAQVFAEIEPWQARKAVVLGAGMMGAAIAYVCARAGIDVVLKDVSLEAAEHGKDYSVKLVEKAIERGRQSREDGDALLRRIHPTDRPEDAAGCDLMIEAVFEDPALKKQVYAETEQHLDPDALLGSNTSTLPITELGAGVSRPEDFIGLHFFSPVDKMPLLEIIKGRETSERALYRALDVAKQVRKTPIVVNDSRGFFTSRVIGTFINEGIAMLLEGVPAATIEQASSQAGYPAPVLQLSDELNMKLMRKIRDASKAAVESSSSGWDAHPAEQVIDRMLDEFDRPGRLEGRGFYEYADGKRVALWRGLRDAFPPVDDPSRIDLRDLKERMLFAESLESVRCLDEGVIESVADANIGSILGIGFPGWTGGVLQYINGYRDPAHGRGPAAFVARARELALAYGERFDPPAALVEKAQRGEVYLDAQEPVAVA